MSSPELVTSEQRRRLILLGGLWVALFALLAAFRGVVLPFAAAGLIAYLVAPLVARITRLQVGGRQVPRWVAILVIYALFFSAVYLAVLLLVPQLYRELARISKDSFDYLNGLTPERVQQLARAAEDWLSNRGLEIELSSRPEARPSPWNLSFDLQQLINGLAVKASAAVQANLRDLVSVTRSLVTGVLTFVFMLFFMLMLAAYMSIDAAAIRGWARTLIPAEYADDVSSLVQRIDRSLSGVVRGQVTICLINGVLTFLGLILFGVKFAFLLATIAMLLSLIPIFGTIISSVPIVAIGLSQSWQTGLSALAWIIGIHAVEAYFLNPRIMGSAARIHPLMVAFALIAGEHTFGLVGALFAVPLAAVAVALFEFTRQKAQPPAPELSPPAPESRAA
jgi:predicted PurR-regulated permease PerM